MRIIKPYRTFPAGEVIEKDHEPTAVFNATQRLANETRLLAIGTLAIAVGTILMAIASIIQTIWG